VPTCKWFNHVSKKRTISTTKKLVDPEEGVTTFLRNIDTYLPVDKLQNLSIIKSS